MAEGKQHALAVGVTTLSTDEMQALLVTNVMVFFIKHVFNFSCRLSVNKGIGVENYHYLNDGLWILKPMK